MKDFKINEFILLRLEEGKTIIYVANERFLQCNFLLLNISVDEVTALNEIESVDEAADKLSGLLEPRNEDYSNYIKESYEITPETEFWGHCSNLQVWVEYEYDTRILRSNLAFPLLKKLVDVGDKKAQKVFKEEIGRRLTSGYYNVIEFLFEEDYVKYLGAEELWTIIPPLLEKLKEKKYQVKWWTYKTELPLLLLLRLVELGDIRALQKLKEISSEILKTNNMMNIEMIYDGGYIKYLTREGFWDVFGQDGEILGELESDIIQYKLTSTKDQNGVTVVSKREKKANELSFFTLSNGIYNDQGPMVFTFEDYHITGIGIWGNERNFFDITHLPTQIYQLKHLETLTLNNVNLKEVSSKVTNLKLLKSLSISKNSITNLPDELFSLPNLEYLGLGCNKLTYLPKTVGDMINLKELYVYGNPLNENTKKYLRDLHKHKDQFVLYLDSP